MRCEPAVLSEDCCRSLGKKRGSVTESAEGQLLYCFWMANSEKETDSFGSVESQCCSVVSAFMYFMGSWKSCAGQAVSSAHLQNHFTWHLVVIPKRKRS